MKIKVLDKTYRNFDLGDREDIEFLHALAEIQKIFKDTPRPEEENDCICAWIHKLCESGTVNSDELDIADCKFTRRKYTLALLDDLRSGLLSERWLLPPPEEELLLDSAFFLRLDDTLQSNTLDFEPISCKNQSLGNPRLAPS